MCSNIFHLQVVLLPYMSNSSTEHTPSHDYRDTPTKPRETAKDRNITHAYSCIDKSNRLRLLKNKNSVCNVFQQRRVHVLCTCGTASYRVWVLQPDLWWRWPGWQRWCRTDGEEGRRHPACFLAVCQRRDTELVRGRWTDTRLINQHIKRSQLVFVFVAVAKILLL